MGYPVSVWIDYYREFPVEEAIRLLSRAGFRYGELSDIHLAAIMERGDPAREGKRLKEFADSLGYTIPQAHLSYQQGLASQSQGDFIRIAGDKLQALHIADNNGLGDTHQMPFSARYGIDWKDVMQGLRDIDYKGLFNLEIVGEWEGTPAIKAAKLAFVRQLTDAMLSDAFVE